MSIKIGDVEEKIYRVDGDKMIVDWKKLNESKILTSTELTILYTLLDKVKDSEESEINGWKYYRHSEDGHA